MMVSGSVGASFAVDGVHVCDPPGLFGEDSVELSVLPGGFLGRVSRGMGALSLGAVVNILSQVIVPVALYVWGKFRFGEWLLLTGMIQFLKITDLGVQTYVVNKLCASFANGDKNEFRRVLHSTLRVQLPLSCAVLGLVALAAALLPAGRLLGLHTVGGGALFAVIMLLSAELLLGVPMGVIAGVYRATGHLARSAILGAAQQFGILVLTLSLIAADSSFVSVAAGQVAVGLLTTGMIFYDLHRLHSWLGFRPTHGSWQEGLKMFGPGLFFFFIPLADYISVQFTLMMVQRSLGGGEVSRLATHRMIVNFGVMISSLLTTAVWPELTAMHALGKTQSLVRVHRTLAKLNLWLVGGLMLTLLPLISVLYPLWTARKLTLDFWTLGFLLARLLLWTLWSAGSTVLCASNRHYRPSIALLLDALIAGVLAVYLVPVLGIRGAALATLLADVSVCAWLMPLLTTREIGEDFVAFAKMSLLAAFALLGPAAICLVAWHLTRSFVVRYTFFAACIGLALVLMLRQIDEEERQLVGKFWTGIRAKSQTYLSRSRGTAARTIT
jgi:O-antigen/teichoic acid export membrane protein